MNENLRADQESIKTDKPKFNFPTNKAPIRELSETLSWNFYKFSDKKYNNLWEFSNIYIKNPSNIPKPKKAVFMFPGIGYDDPRAFGNLPNIVTDKAEASYIHFYHPQKNFVMDNVIDQFIEFIKENPHIEEIVVCGISFWWVSSRKLLSSSKLTEDLKKKIKWYLSINWMTTFDDLKKESQKQLSIASKIPKPLASLWQRIVKAYQKISPINPKIKENEFFEWREKSYTKVDEKNYPWPNHIDFTPEQIKILIENMRVHRIYTNNWQLVSSSFVDRANILSDEKELESNLSRIKNKRILMTKWDEYFDNPTEVAEKLWKKIKGENVNLSQWKHFWIDLWPEEYNEALIKEFATIFN